MLGESVKPGDRVEVRRVWINRVRLGGEYSYNPEEIWVHALACTPPMEDGSIGVLHPDGTKEMVQSRNWRRA